MKTWNARSLFLISGIFISTSVLAHEDDDPLLWSFMAEQFEWRESDGADPVVLDGQGWVGKDLNKLWLKLDLEQRNSHLDELELQALYGRAVAPYWDVLVGVRQDVRPEPSKTWGVIGVQGLAPYFFETDMAVFIGDEGAVAARLSLEYELLFTQRLILSPELSIDLYGQNDEETATGSGLAELSVGLRLRYEIRPEFAPYVGLQWEKKYGRTADFARTHGEATGEAAAVAGIRFCF